MQMKINNLNDISSVKTTECQLMLLENPIKIRILIDIPIGFYVELWLELLKSRKTAHIRLNTV